MALVPKAELTKIFLGALNGDIARNTKIASLINQNINRLFKLIKIKFLGHHTHILFGQTKILINIMSKDFDRTSGLAHQRTDNTNGSGLARTIGAQQSKKVPGRHIEVNTLEGLKLIVVGLAELLYGQCWLCGIVQLMLSILVMVTRKYIVALSTQDVWF